MEREYVQRRNPPVGHPARRRRPTTRKKSGPPPIFFAALALIAIVVAIVLIITLSGKEKDTPHEETSSLVSETVSSIPTTEPEVTPTPSPAPTTTAAEDPTSAPTFYDSMMTIDDSGFSYYHFQEETAKRYIDAVSSAASDLGSTTLYNIIIPSSTDIMLSNSYLETNNVSSSNQRSAIEWINSSFAAINSAIKTVPLFDTLRSYSGEYVYFRTDAHWTQLGAYYGYQKFCAVKGVSAPALTEYTKTEYSGYLGSYYNTVYDDAMSANPDTVEVYELDGNTSLTYTDSDGNTQSGWPVILDGSDYDSSYLYYIFCAGNQSYEVLQNHDLSDGSACVVVKDSSGNVFLPYLTEQYQSVYAIDYRYYTGSALQLANEVGATDLIIINEIDATADSDKVSQLETVLS